MRLSYFNRSFTIFHVVHGPPPHFPPGRRWVACRTMPTLPFDSDTTGRPFPIYGKGFACNLGPCLSFPHLFSCWLHSLTRILLSPLISSHPLPSLPIPYASSLYRSSELSKLVANAFLAQRISSINSISALCEVTHADVQEVSRAIGMDRRIGPNFLNASVGFGGSCFQKDILNLSYLCESFGLQDVAEYWNQVVKINDWQKRRFANRIIGDMFGNIAGKRIVLFGFAFKKDTTDTRETPAISVAKHLLQERPQLVIYDPMVEEDQIRCDFEEYKALPEGTKFEDLVTVAKCPYEATKGAHAIAVITEWNQFRDLKYDEIYASMEKPSYIFDGRNILNHKALIKQGFRLYAVGKPYGSRASMDETYYVAPEDLE